MPLFEPKANEQFPLRIESQDRYFQALEHPRAPGFAHAMEGGKAFVYRLKELNSSDGEYALKVMKAKHRDPSLEDICNKLDALKTVPGLGVCERCCLSPSNAPDAIRQFKDLSYAILMPWVQGFSWFDVLYLGKKGQHTLTIEQSVTLALNLADILARLEERGIAHCDLSAGNIILDAQTLTVELLDVEDVFAPGFRQPASLPLGTPGYQHKTSAQGQWGATADRFAAAVLLSEMLGWHDTNAKDASYGETYFEPAELQKPNVQRFDVLVGAISSHRNAEPLIDLLRAAWESDTLDACPSIQQWAQAIKSVKTGVRFSQLKTDSARQAKPKPVGWTPLPKGAGNNAPPVTWSDAIKPGDGPANQAVRWADQLPSNATNPSTPVTWGDISEAEEEVENGNAN